MNAATSTIGANNGTLVTDKVQLRDGVASYIRALIVSGQAQAGTLLRLGAIAKDLDVSLTPVREAMLLLDQEGWVQQEPNRGFRVVRFKRADVVDAYFVNELVAAELAGRAAERIDEATVAQLREIEARIRAADDADERVDTWNSQLHGIIYATAESPRLVWFIDAAARFVPRGFWPTIEGWRAHNRTGHAEIINALEDHDPERAREATRNHISTSGRLLLNHLDHENFFNEETSD